jgi:Glycosyl transferases group 1
MRHDLTYGGVMTFCVLSTRNLVSSVSHDPVYELEDILVQSCGAQLLTPLARGITPWVQQQSGLIGKVTNKLVNRTIGYYQPIEPESSQSRVLIMVVLTGADIAFVSSIPNWRQRFDRVVAYVFDSWSFEIYARQAFQLDHIFVALPELVDDLHNFLKVPVSLLPFGADVLTHGSGQIDRPIDLMSYGRIPEQFQLAFSQHFNRPASQKIYYRSTPRSTEHFPQKPYPVRRDVQDTLQIYNMLRRSKLGISFDTLYPGMRKFPYSFVTLRWFQCGAAGCAIIGKRPTTPLADQLLDWEDATIELPDQPEASIELIEDLLTDQPRLQAIHRRNYQQNLLRHDWRHRIKQMLTTLEIALPDRLTDELSKLQEAAQNSDSKV